MEQIVISVFVISILGSWIMLNNPTVQAEYFYDETGNITGKILIENIPDIVDMENFTISENLTEGALRGIVNLSNITVAHIKELKLFHIEIEPGLFSHTLTTNIYFPRINISTNYTADLHLYEFIPVYNKGGLIIFLKDFFIRMNCEYYPLFHKISDVNVTINSVEDIDFDLRGALDNEGVSIFLSSTLRLFAAKIVNEDRSVISYYTKLILENIITYILDTYV